MFVLRLFIYGNYYQRIYTNNILPSVRDVAWQNYTARFSLLL